MWLMWTVASPPVVSIHIRNQTPLFYAAVAKAGAQIAFSLQLVIVCCSILAASDRFQCSLMICVLLFCIILQGSEMGGSASKVFMHVTYCENPGSRITMSNSTEAH